MKGETDDNNRVTVGECYTPISTMDRSGRKSKRKQWS